MGGAFITCGGTGEVLTGFWWGYLRERDYSFRIGMGSCTGWIWLRIGTGGGRGSEPSGYIKCEEFF
jgi:hypothetical protein